MDKIKAFCERGYFPIQLPPGFTSAEFAAKHKQLSPTWTAQQPPRCRAEKFSVARASYKRRVTSILNPVAFYFLVKEITTYWSRIQTHYSKTSLSLSRPKLEPSLRAIEITRFNQLYEAKVVRSAGYKYALLTDISRFFPTIYTHSIPWALHGKETAKNNKAKVAKYFGNILDHRSMGVQDWQTMGLPIGPDTSHVIAEIIATAIDVELRTLLGSAPPGLRYVDDYCFFLNSRDEAEKLLAELSKILNQFELQINPDKTKIIAVKDLVQESWTYSVRNLAIDQHIHRQRDDIHKFFESLFSLEERFRDESVVKYGLKKLGATIIKRKNWDVYEAYLLKCGYAFPNCLQVITTILATYHRHKYPLTKKAIQMFCNNIIQTHAISDGHSEMIWALWLAKEVDARIESASVRAVENSSSSVCKLVCLDLARDGLTSRSPLKRSVAHFASRDALFGDGWLLAYEAGKRRWLFNKDISYIKGDGFFSELLLRDISFYDGSKRCEALFELKEDKQSVNLNDLFDSDADVDKFFDFADSDDEYHDHDKASGDENDAEENDGKEEKKDETEQAPSPFEFDDIF